MGYNFGAILYMALGFYLVAGFLLVGLLFTVGTLLVRRYSHLDRKPGAVPRHRETYPGFPGRMREGHPVGHA